MKEFIGPHSIANSIRMNRTQFAGSFLITEGDKDARLFKAHSDTQRCRIVNAVNKSNAIGALELLENSPVTGILAIVDADFERLEGRLLNSENLIYSDYHDLEVMLFTSAALDRVLIEFGSVQKIENFEKMMGARVRTMLIEAGSYIGHFRWLSLQSGLHLNFEDMPVGKFLDPSTLEVNLPTMIKCVKQHSQKHAIDESGLLEELQRLIAQPYDKLQVCCGHDLSEILSFALRKTIGSHDSGQVKSEILERSLRLAFDPNLLASTNLYRSVRLWEARNAPYIVFTSVMEIN